MQDLLAYYVLDRSGSMADLWTDTIGGLQQYFQDQAAQPGKTWVTLRAFDDVQLVPFEAWAATDVDVDKVLKQQQIRPRGMTALLDAIGQGIRQQEALLADRPWFKGLVQFVVQTDGFENSSREYTRDQIKSLIESHPDWEFVFMGAGIDSIGEARSLGIALSNSISYDSHNVGAAYSGLSQYSSIHRSTYAGGVVMDSLTNTGQTLQTFVDEADDEPSDATPSPSK